jgi:DNA-binding response OmpR family regulator
MNPTIVICEDDYDLGSVLSDYLTNNNFNVILTSCSEELDMTCSNISPDALLLDLQLPGEDGLSIAKRFHSKRPNLPIIMMSVTATDQNQSTAYDNGAMLFLPKPFQPAALKAMLGGLFRMQSAAPNGLVLYSSDATIALPEGVLKLTRRESKVMQLMILRMPAVVETYELLEAISSDREELASKSSIEVLISRLRKKFRDNNLEREQLNIRSEHGIGYSLHGKITLAT